jgi:hypothetical protein
VPTCFTGGRKSSADNFMFNGFEILNHFAIQGLKGKIIAAMAATNYGVNTPYFQNEIISNGARAGKCKCGRTTKPSQNAFHFGSIF